MSSKDNVDKSKQVKSVAGKPETKSSNDAKANVKSTAKETKKEEKNLKKKYVVSEDDDEDDNVCTFRFQTTSQCVFVT
jgi:hypothetical protein